MTDIIESARQQATDDCVAFAEFITQYKKKQDILYCFFEGYEDQTFYPIRIESYSKAQDYRDYVCGGKEEVLKVHNLIKNHSHYKTTKTAFFVDRDFDSELINDDVYVTPTYSIENFYCFEGSVGKVLRAEFKINVNHSDYTICLENYRHRLQEFNQQILLLNAWLACQADYRSANRMNTRLKIDKKLKRYFDNVVKPDLQTIEDFSVFDSKESLEKIFENSPIIDDQTLNEKIQLFKSVNHTYIFRGKFLIYFLTNYLSRLQSIMGTSNSPFEKQYSCSLRFENTTICTTLSQHAVTSECLKAYVLKVSTGSNLASG